MMHVHYLPISPQNHHLPVIPTLKAACFSPGLGCVTPHSIKLVLGFHLVACRIVFLIEVAHNQLYTLLGMQCNYCTVVQIALFFPCSSLVLVRQTCLCIHICLLHVLCTLNVQDIVQYHLCICLSCYSCRARSPNLALFSSFFSRNCTETIFVHSKFLYHDINTYHLSQLRAKSVGKSLWFDTESTF